MTTKTPWIVSAVPNYREIDFQEGCPYGPVTHSDLFHAWQRMLRTAYCRPESLSPAELLNSPVCFEWRSFRPFVDWALAAGFSGKALLKKRNPHESFCPANCYWEAIKEPKRPQARAVRRAPLTSEAIQDIRERFMGWEASIYELARFYGVPERTVQSVIQSAPGITPPAPLQQV